MTTIFAARQRHKEFNHSYPDVEHCETLFCEKFRAEVSWPTPRERDIQRAETLLAEAISILRGVA